MTAHAQADDRHFGHLGVEGHAAGADLLGRGLHPRQGFLRVPPGHGEGEVGKPVGTGILDNHIHHDVIPGDRPEQFGREAGPVGHMENSDFRLIEV